MLMTSKIVIKQQETMDSAIKISLIEILQIQLLQFFTQSKQSA